MAQGIFQSNVFQHGGVFQLATTPGTDSASNTTAFNYIRGNFRPDSLRRRHR